MPVMIKTLTSCTANQAYIVCRNTVVILSRTRVSRPFQDGFLVDVNTLPGVKVNIICTTIITSIFNRSRSLILNKIYLVIVVSSFA